jgi:hypothetical protein
MRESILQKDQGEHGQVLDVARLIEAVRGSQAARVLYELRPLFLSTGQNGDGTTSGAAVPPNPSVTCAGGRSTD